MSRHRGLRGYHAIRAFRPAIATVSPREAFRAGIGAMLALGLIGLASKVWPTALHPALALIAPFGASSVLIFSVPNSPLAQPWSVIVGNTIAAVIGIVVWLCIQDPVLRAALAVGLAIIAMMLLRAVHPPAGAVAMTAAMSSGEAAFPKNTSIPRARNCFTTSARSSITR